jgi:hypothetical protein
MPVLIEVDFRHLVLFVRRRSVGRGARGRVLATENGPDGRSRRGALVGVCGLVEPGRGSSARCAAVGDVEHTKVLRDKGQELRMVALDGLVEGVLALDQRLCSRHEQTCRGDLNYGHTLQTARREKRKMWLWPPT